MSDTVHYHFEDPGKACVEEHDGPCTCGHQKHWRECRECYCQHRGPSPYPNAQMDLARRLHLISHEHPELWDVTPDCGCLVRARVMLDAVVVDGRAYFGGLPRGQ